MPKSCYFVNCNYDNFIETVILLMTDCCMWDFVYFALKSEKSPRSGQKNTAISINVHRGKDTNGLASAQGPERLCLLVPQSYKSSMHIYIIKVIKQV